MYHQYDAWFPLLSYALGGLVLGDIHVHTMRVMRHYILQVWACHQYCVRTCRGYDGFWQWETWVAVILPGIAEHIWVWLFRYSTHILSACLHWVSACIAVVWGEPATSLCYMFPDLEVEGGIACSEAVFYGNCLGVGVGTYIGLYIRKCAWYPTQGTQYGTDLPRYCSVYSYYMTCYNVRYFICIGSMSQCWWTGLLSILARNSKIKTLSLMLQLVNYTP